MVLFNGYGFLEEVFADIWNSPNDLICSSNGKSQVAQCSSQWNLPEKTDTLECLHQAVTHPSTNIANACLTS